MARSTPVRMQPVRACRAWWWRVIPIWWRCHRPYGIDGIAGVWRAGETTGGRAGGPGKIRRRSCMVLAVKGSSRCARRIAPVIGAAPDSMSRGGGVILSIIPDRGRRPRRGAGILRRLLVRGLLRRVDSDYLIDQIDRLESKSRPGMMRRIQPLRNLARQAERAKVLLFHRSQAPRAGAQSKRFR